MSTLSDYVMRRLQAGRSGTEICTELIAVGWSKEAADAAYREGLIALGIPLPNDMRALPDTPADTPAGTPVPKATTIDLAVNLFSFLLLGIVVSAFIVLCFSLIEHALPDAAERVDGHLQIMISQTIHRSMASIAIAFPLYLFAMRWWIRRFSTGHERSEAAVTRRITYLVLMVASAVIVCDLITLVYSLLQGEMTIRFLLKLAAVLGIATIVFSFYLFERRSVQFAKVVPARVFRIFGWSSSAVVLATVLAGYLSAGSPQTARSLAADAARSNDLAALAGCINRYAEEMGHLPESLHQLELTSPYASCPTYDRQIRQRFAYRIVVGSRTEGEARVGEFELCAHFALASTPQAAPVPQGAESWFDHPAGRSCRVKAVQLIGRTRP